jgi:hypothetical protein
MLITLRLPRSSALRLNLAVDDVEGQEVVATLTAVELAGRLTLGTGKAVSPEAVVRYCVAWQAARETLRGLVEKHGEAGLAKMLREECGDRALWVPRKDVATLRWLQCVLESHILSSAKGRREVPIARSTAMGQVHSAAGLVELCEAAFPQAYGLWLTEEASRPPDDPVASHVEPVDLQAGVQGSA